MKRRISQGQAMRSTFGRSRVTQRLGFSLAEIRELFELYDISRDEKKQLEEFLVRLERRRVHLEQQREDIDVMLNEITFFANECRQLLKGKPGSVDAKAGSQA